ncbi:MAG: hypothetical protein Kow0037_01970 [Calditrichia bacterium]
MKSIFIVFWMLFVVFSIEQDVLGQLSAPEVEDVYGGRIKAISITEIDSANSLVYISTESANSMFYTTVEHTSGGPVGHAFKAVPDLDLDDGYGGGVTAIQTDEESGFFFALYQDKIISADTTAGSRVEVVPFGVRGIKVYDQRLFYLQEEPPGQLQLHFGTIDAASGAFSEASESPIAVGTAPVEPIAQLDIDPLSGCLYIFLGGTAPSMFKSSDSYHSLTGSTNFSTIDLSALGNQNRYAAFAIAPDSRIFIGGVKNQEPFHTKFIGYSDDGGASWDTLDTQVGGASGANIAIADHDSTYWVYFGTAMSTNKGEINSWQPIGSSSFETHPNDGWVAVDTIDPFLVVVTTDQGIGASVDGGMSIFEVNDGVEAVQVNDIEMDAAKNEAWLASKSGIRRVSGYSSGSKMWDLFFPNNDGSPYYSVAMDTTHPDTAYAGNVRVYRTFDGGATWQMLLDTGNPTHGFDFFSYVSALEVVQFKPELVFAGVNSPSSGVTGGIFFSRDYGNNWQRVSTGVYNPEVTDILVVPSIGDTVTAFVACDYVNDGTTSSYGVKEVTYLISSDSLSFKNDMVGNSGTNITNFGATDLAVNSAGDVFACGYNSSNEPRVYVMMKDSTFWQMLPTAGLPISGKASALTVGLNTLGEEVPYLSIENDIYNFDPASGNWTLSFSYPVGSKISVLFWDDLMVGTATGLYSHQMNLSGVENGAPNTTISRFVLHQNYPNPFNPQTTIKYMISERARVKLEIFNLTGQQIDKLIYGVQNAGEYEVNWRPDLPSGVYFYRLRVEGLKQRQLFEETRKMILLK